MYLYTKQVSKPIRHRGHAECGTAATVEERGQGRYKR